MKIILSFCLLLACSLGATELPDHPNGPDLSLTPGELCTQPTRRRYPEGIAYCDRAVDREMKDEVFRIYRKKGFTLSEPRDRYKIDHYIPLCAGGSNSIKNLWPQHSSIYQVTDEIEGLGCSKLSLGLIKQRALLDLIRKVKADNSKAAEVVKYLYSL